MTRSPRPAGLALSLLLLAGCASTRSGGEALALPSVTVDEFLSMQPVDRKQPIAAADRDLRLAERRAERAELLVPLADSQVRIARAEAGARKAAVKRADAQLALVRRQHQAVFAGAPADSGTVPDDVQRALQRFEQAEQDVDVARWWQEQADALVRVREQELAYAQTFRDAARRDVELQRAETDLAKMRLVTQATVQILPGVADPRLSVAQSSVREAQANYAKAHAEAMTRLADAQMRRAGMASFEAGPPPMASLSGSPGQSGAAGLVSRPVAIEAEPLPWPDAWEEPQAEYSNPKAR